MSDLADQIAALVKKSGLTPDEVKAALREAVQKSWPAMPPWTTLKNGPVIEETQKASVGSGAVPTFVENGVRYVVLAQAGEHYRRPGAPLPESYMIAGGFINLTSTPGSSMVPAAPDHAENPTTGAAREIEEELKIPTGAPLLSIDPMRLQVMDTLTLDLPHDEKRLVLGQMLELAPSEIATVKNHIARMERDPAYKAAVIAQSANHESGLPEVSGLTIRTLDDAAGGAVPLLHPDQISLFQKIARHFAQQPHLAPAFTAAARSGPTRAGREKIKTLEELKDAVAAARTASPGHLTVGVTSGAFDLVHPGHISFLEDAARHCDFLVVVIASDRTVRDQKGTEKPYIGETKRAETIAAICTVDAVIVSDEKYHETILSALHPDILFKGDDYAHMKIMGADLVGSVILIPCAEKEFYSSSEFVRRIKFGQYGPFPPQP